MIKIAINGFGRIGRQFFRLASEKDDIEIVAINDLGDKDNLLYLLKYDSAYGKFENTNKIESVRFFQEKDPLNLPWKELSIDIVVESTGFFEEYKKAKAHIDAGAKRVVISAPAKGDESSLGKTILMGVNETELNTCSISSNASCTTNSVSPVAQIMNETVGVKKAILNTIHGYTATQKLVDSPDAKDWRRGRAAAINIVPSTTGAATAVTKVIKELKDKFDGIATRVPVVTGSITDFTFLAGKETTVKEIQDIFRKAAKEERWKGIFAVTDEELVSSDIVGSTYASIVDLSFIKVVDGDLVKVLAWYDNEMGYTYSLLQHVIKAGGLL